MPFVTSQGGPSQKTPRLLKLSRHDRRSGKLLHLFMCLSHVYVQVSSCVFPCVCVSYHSCKSVCVCACVWRLVQMANTLTCLSHPAPEPVSGALGCSSSP